MIKKVIVLMVILLTGCSLLRARDDSPPHPQMTPIVEWPQVTATVTLEPRLHPILLSDLQEAETFLLIVKTSLAAGDDTGIAELVKYPLRVQMDGQEIKFNNQQEFLDQYEKIFDRELVNMLSQMDESDLILLPNGIQVGNGTMWLNSFCVDLTCSDSRFLITQINK